MPNYLAMARLAGAKIPGKIVVTANTVVSAIEQMCLSFGVPDTGSFEAYDLLEIVEDGGAYRPVASKDGPDVREGRIRRRNTRMSTALTVVPPTSPDVVDKDSGEPQYVPYEVEEAA